MSQENSKPANEAAPTLSTLKAKITEFLKEDDSLTQVKQHSNDVEGQIKKLQRVLFSLLNQQPENEGAKKEDLQLLY